LKTANHKGDAGEKKERNFTENNECCLGKKKKEHEGPETSVYGKNPN